MMTLYFGDGFIDDNELYLLVMTNDSWIADRRFVDRMGLNRESRPADPWGIDYPG